MIPAKEDDAIVTVDGDLLVVLWVELTPCELLDDLGFAQHADDRTLGSLV